LVAPPPYAGARAWCGLDPSAASLPADLEALGRDLHRLEARDFDARLRATRSAVERIDAETGWRLAVLFALGLHRSLGFTDAAHYARERLGMSGRKARALVAIERKAREVPELLEACRSGQLSWLGALTVLAAAGPRTGAAWVARATEVTLETWFHQPRHRDPVFERDGWRCAVPGCSARRNLHDHHLVFRSRGGHNGRDNRVSVCAWHHLRGIHAGRVRAWGEAPDHVHWELGVGRGRALLRFVGERYLG
jgi:5-methylcytosine-specific restriction endonuclease McrA